jgi:hypothetical protein
MTLSSPSMAMLTGWRMHTFFQLSPVPEQCCGEAHVCPRSGLRAGRQASAGCFQACCSRGLPHWWLTAWFFLISQLPGEGYK